MPDSDVVLRRPDDLSPKWLAETLGSRPIASFTAEAIGTGQMSDSFRVSLAYDGDGGPESVVLKVAATDATSRSTGIQLGIYEREVRFYREVAPGVDGPIATCHHAAFDSEEGWFTLLLEDAAPATQGDQIAGCSPAHARLAITELARIHASTWEDRRLEAKSWLTAPSPLDRSVVVALFPGFLERYDARLAPEHREVCERFVHGLDAWLDVRPRPFAVQHADYRLDNMLFGLEGGRRPLTVVDWQTVNFGSVMQDVAYLLGGSLVVDDRRAHEQALLGAYHEVLLSRGIADFDWDACWEGYRRYSLYGVLMAVAASMLVVRTQRGDDMFMTFLARAAQHALDLDALDLLDSDPA